VIFTQTIHFHQFVPGAQKPVEPQYFGFGMPGESFMVHLITAPPDFDRVVKTDGEETYLEYDDLKD
jgi:hypothetical protein